MDKKLEKLIAMIAQSLSDNLIRLALMEQKTEKEQEEMLQKLVEEGCLESIERYKSLPFQFDYSATCEFVAYLCFLLRFDEKVFAAVKEVDPSTYKYIQDMKSTRKYFNIEKNYEQSRN